MPTIAYLANQFPSPVEPYVLDEIMALRRTGVEVVPCSAWQASAKHGSARIVIGGRNLMPDEIEVESDALWRLAVSLPPADGLGVPRASAVSRSGISIPPLEGALPYGIGRLRSSCVSRTWSAPHSCPPWILRRVDRAGCRAITRHQLQYDFARLGSAGT